MANTNASPLLELPAEVRNDIFHLALQQPDPISICWFGEGPQLEKQRGNQGRSKRHLTALTAASRQIRDECTQLFYACNAFRLVSNMFSIVTMRAEEADINYHHIEWIWEWLVQIGEKNYSALESVTVDLGTWPCHKMGHHMRDPQERICLVLSALVVFFELTKTVCSCVVSVGIKCLCTPCQDDARLTLSLPSVNKDMMVAYHTIENDTVDNMIPGLKMLNDALYRRYSRLVWMMKWIESRVHEPRKTITTAKDCIPRKFRVLQEGFSDHGGVDHSVGLVSHLLTAILDSRGLTRRYQPSDYSHLWESSSLPRATTVVMQYCVPGSGEA